MKKTLLFLAVLCSLAASAAVNTPADPSTLRIYVNPGHGSWGDNDRPFPIIREVNGVITTISPKSSQAVPDTTAFFESNTNLEKCLALVDRLIDYGLVVDKTKNQTNSNPYNVGWSRDLSNNIVMSRTKNGPYPNTGSGYSSSVCNRSLLEIAREAHTNNFDMFIAVHSNGGTDGSTANYLLYLYRGVKETQVAGTHGTEAVAGSFDMACHAWDRMYNHPFHKWTQYLKQSDYSGVKSDRQFYTWVEETDFTTNALGCYGYLSVMKHKVPGYLTEGYFHTYQPARLRAMNFDTDRIEGFIYARGIADYFKLPLESTGEIYGLVRDQSETFTHTYYKPNTSTNDKYKPINSCTVILKKDGEEIARKTTDNHYNGAFVFERLAPGNYTIDLIHPNYKNSLNLPVTVTAATTQFEEYFLEKKGNVELARAAYPFKLNMDMDKDNRYLLKFYSTEDAKDAVITLTNTSDPSDVRTFSVGEVSSGENTYVFDSSSLTEGAEYTWGVTINSYDLTAPTLSYEAAQKPVNETTAYPYVSRGAVVVFNDPSLPTYGMVVTATGQNQGINVYSPDLSFTGNYKPSPAPFSSSNYSPYRGATRGDKAVFVDWGNNQGGFWEFDPLNPTAPMRNLLAGTATNGVSTYNGTIVGGSATGIDFLGSGSDEKLYVFSQHHQAENGTTYLTRYDIGGASQITSAPDKMYNSIGWKNGDCDIAAIEEGVFICRDLSSQPLSSTVTGSGFVFVNNQGEILASSSSISGMPATPNNSIAISEDKSLLAVGDNAGNVMLFDVAWSNGVPSFTYSTRFATPAYNSSICKQQCQMKFDPAGNLFMFIRGMGLYAFSMPRTGKSMSMDAPADQLIHRVAPPAPVPFAYDLTMTMGEAYATVSFNSTAEALNGTLKLVNGSEVLTYPLGSVIKGPNSIMVPLEDLTANVEYTWSVTLESQPITRPRCMVNSPRAYDKEDTRGGIVVITDPMQPSFGKVITSSGFTQGFDVFAPDGEHLGTYADNRPDGRQRAASGFSLYRGAERKGKAVFCDWSDPGAGFWVFDPENPNAQLTDMLLGTVQTSTGCHTYNGTIIGGGSPGLCFLGDGDDERLYAFVEDYPASSSQNLVRYDLHGADVIDHAPAFVYPSSLRSMFYDEDFYCRYIVEVVAIEEGLFLSRTATTGSNTVAAPGFIFVDHEGNVLFNSHVDLPDAELKTLGNGIALSADKTTLAVSNYADGIEIYNVSWSNGVPTLTYSYKIPTEAEHVGEHTQMKFDYAGNLAVFGRGWGYQLYTLINPAPSVTTPARPEFNIIRRGFEGAHVDLVDLNEYTFAVGAEDIDVSYTRNFTETTWEGLYLPFDLDYDEWSEYAEVAELYNLHVYSDGTTVLEFATLGSGSSLEPHIPYLVKADEANTVTFQGSHKTLEPAPVTPGWIDCFSTRQHFILTGTYTTRIGAANEITPEYTLDNNSFDRIEEDTTIDPFRVYLTIEPRNAYGRAAQRAAAAALPQKVKIMVDGKLYDDSTTGIEGVIVEEGAQAIEGVEFFNLQGQRVSRPAQGSMVIRRCAGSTDKIIYK